MRATILSSLISILLAPSAGAATISVFASVDQWQDSGVDIWAGDYLSVEAFGEVDYSIVAFVNPDGIGNFQDGTVIGGDLAPSAIIYSLVGKIGGTTAPGTGTLLPEGAPGKGPGFVGTNYLAQAPVSGRLYFGFNDSQPWTDNARAFTVRFAVPEPSSVVLTGLAGVLMLGAVFRRRVLG